MEYERIYRSLFPSYFSIFYFLLFIFLVYSFRLEKLEGKGITI